MTPLDAVLRARDDQIEARDHAIAAIELLTFKAIALTIAEMNDRIRYLTLAVGDQGDVAIERLDSHYGETISNLLVEEDDGLAELLDALNDTLLRRYAQRGPTLLVEPASGASQGAWSIDLRVAAQLPMPE